MERLATRERGVHLHTLEYRDAEVLQERGRWSRSRSDSDRGRIQSKHRTNYSRILVLLNIYFSYFEFWSNLVKLWSNNGQTNYSRNISVTKSLLFFKTIVSKSNSEMCHFMIKQNS